MGSGDTLEELVASWKPYVELAFDLHSMYNRPVAYTEIGYCSGQCSRNHVPSTVDYTAHALKYEAVFEAFRGKDWFLGAFWWNWNTDPGAFNTDDCLTPQFKLAEDVLRKYYRATQPKPSPFGEA